MPPESLVSNVYSTKSDIFSVGILLFEMLVGSTPWESRTEKELIRKMTTVPFKIPEKAQLTNDIRNLLRSMCATENSHRMDREEFLNLRLERPS